MTSDEIYLDMTDAQAEKIAYRVYEREKRPPSDSEKSTDDSCFRYKLNDIERAAIQICKLNAIYESNRQYYQEKKDAEEQKKYETENQNRFY
jgi:hypothetical protein